MTLLRPEWLLALPILVLLAVVVRRRAASPGAWARAIDPHLMAAMRRLGRVESHGASASAFLPLFAAGAIALALAGPAMERRDAAAFRNLDGAILVVDASASMVESPAWTDVVTALRTALAGLGSKPVALVVAAGDAYVASPLTTDSRQVGLTLSLIDAETVPDAGSRPALGLAEAAAMLQDADILRADVVFATDGGGLGPEALVEARRIADMGARVLVGWVGTEAAEDRALAESLAAAGGGDVLDVGQSVALSAALAPGAGDRIVRQDLRLLFQVDYGRYLLALALLPLVLLFRRDAS
jgi:Ca-activated chloride channel family protein